MCLPSLYRIIRELGTRTGQKVRPHGLRHTSISEAVRRVQAVGMDVTKVLQFSRHKDLKTLQVYVDQVEDAKETSLSWWLGNMAPRNCGMKFEIDESVGHDTITARDEN